MAEELNYVLALLNHPEGQIKKCYNCIDCNSNQCPQLYNSDDYCNDNRLRNYETVDYSQYNCGGFALNTFNWFLPKYNAINLDEYKNITEITAKSMTNIFRGDLRIIYSLNEILNDEYAIMFRFEYENNPLKVSSKLCHGCNCIEIGCSDCRALDGEDIDWYLGDFHFIREFNGQWLHKPGSSTIREISIDDIFKPWASAHRGDRYYGDIVIMAMKKTRDILLNIQGGV